MTAVLCLYCRSVNEHPLSGVVRVQPGKLFEGQQQQQKNLWEKIQVPAHLLIVTE